MQRRGGVDKGRGVTGNIELVVADGGLESSAFIMTCSGWYVIWPTVAWPNKNIVNQPSYAFRLWLVAIKLSTLRHAFGFLTFSTRVQYTIKKESQEFLTSMIDSLSHRIELVIPRLIFYRVLITGQTSAVSKFIIAFFYFSFTNSSIFVSLIFLSRNELFIHHFL